MHIRRLMLSIALLTPLFASAEAVAQVFAQRRACDCTAGIGTATLVAGISSSRVRDEGINVPHAPTVGLSRSFAVAGVAPAGPRSEARSSRFRIPVAGVATLDRSAAAVQPRSVTAVAGVGTAGGPDQGKEALQRTAGIGTARTPVAGVAQASGRPEGISQATRVAGIHTSTTRTAGIAQAGSRDEGRGTTHAVAGIASLDRRSAAIGRSTGPSAGIGTYTRDHGINSGCCGNTLGRDH